MKKLTDITNESGSSRMDTSLKMLLIAFISLLAFSSGVYFGKQLSDSDYQLKALESDFNGGHGTKAADAGQHETNPEDAITQEEVAAISDKLVNGEKSEMNKHGEGADEHSSAETRKVASDEHATEHTDTHTASGTEHTATAHESEAHAAHGAHTEAAPAEAATVKHEHGESHGETHGAKAEAAHAAVAEKAPTHKPDLSVAAKAAQRVANNANPSDPEKDTGHERRVPTSLPNTVGVSQDVEFTVQVASYPTAEAAKEHADELVKKGFPAFPVEATVNGKVWYRVSVGSFKTLREATAYRGQLVKQTTVPSAIVQKIQR